MGNVTLQDLLDSGISIEELLFNKDPTEVNVTVDTSELMKMLEKNQKMNNALMVGLQKMLASGQSEQKDMLTETMKFLIQNEQEKSVAIPPITGLDIIRDEEGRMSTLRFIRDEED